MFDFWTILGLFTLLIGLVIGVSSMIYCCLNVVYGDDSKKRKRKTNYGERK